MGLVGRVRVEGGRIGWVGGMGLWVWIWRRGGLGRATRRSTCRMRARASWRAGKARAIGVGPSLALAQDKLTLWGSAKPRSPSIPPITITTPPTPTETTRTTPSRPRAGLIPSCSLWRASACPAHLRGIRTGRGWSLRCGLLEDRDRSRSRCIRIRRCPVRRSGSLSLGQLSEQGWGWGWARRRRGIRVGVRDT